MKESMGCGGRGLNEDSRAKPRLSLINVAEAFTFTC